MKDLLVVTPTRGRPAFMRRLAAAMEDTCQARTDLVFGVDDDDEPSLAVTGLPSFVTIETGPRMQLGPWTNKLAAAHASGYRAVASLGDDHVPRTPGWDRLALEALDAMGGGIVCPLSQSSLGFPEAPVMSTVIVEALGWMCEPGLLHWYVDQVWYDLGRYSFGHYGVLTSPPVWVTHDRPPGGDRTAAESWELLDRDRVAYAGWLAERAPGDFEIVRKALG